MTERSCNRRRHAPRRAWHIAGTGRVFPNSNSYAVTSADHRPGRNTSHGRCSLKPAGRRTPIPLSAGTHLITVGVTAAVCGPRVFMEAGPARFPPIAAQSIPAGWFRALSGSASSSAVGDAAGSDIYPKFELGNRSPPIPSRASLRFLTEVLTDTGSPGIISPSSGWRVLWLDRISVI